MANTEGHLLRKEAGMKRWSTDVEMLFGGKAAAPICQLHTEAKVRSFKTSSLPVKKKKKKIKHRLQLSNCSAATLSHHLLTLDLS